jgi:hypothetical protein
VYCEHRGKRWVRTASWKLYDNDRLFDMQNDAFERQPVDPESESPQAAAARAMLRAALNSLDRPAATK